MKSTPSILIGLFLITSIAQGQHPVVQQEVIAAEKNFANHSVKHNTRDAFVMYMSDDGILFNKNEPVNGKKLWEARTPDQSLLSWWPQYADISSDGTFGYTTGPWFAKGDRSSEKPDAFGYYSTVWRKQNGEWKAALDISIPLPNGIVSADTLVSTPHRSPLSEKQFIKASYPSIKIVDSLYNQELSKKQVTFLAKRFADESRIHRRGQWPFTSPKDFSRLTESIKEIGFKSYQGSVSPGSDLTFTYGTAHITDKDGTEKPQKYLRVWKFIDGEWKIVLDVLS